MIRFALLFLVACSSSNSQPAAPAPAPAPARAPAEPSTPMTKEECEAQGHRFNPSIGGGDQPHCAEGETEVGPARFGIEGGWCCKKPG